MIDPRKVALFGHLLKQSFPGDHVNDAEDTVLNGWFYRIAVGSSSQQRHRVRVTSEFLDDSNEATIRSRFANWHVADVIKRAGNRLVVVDHGGVKVLGEENAL